jgi:hypothetical protein
MLAAADLDRRITAIAGPILSRIRENQAPGVKWGEKRTGGDGKALIHVCIDGLITPGCNDVDRVNMD